MVKMTIDQLKEMVEHAENRIKHGNMTENLYVSIKKYPNGIEYVEFEQPCSYADCNSNYYRYDNFKVEVIE